MRGWPQPCRRQRSECLPALVPVFHALVHRLDCCQAAHARGVPSSTARGTRGSQPAGQPGVFMPGVGRAACRRLAARAFLTLGCPAAGQAAGQLRGRVTLQAASPCGPMLADACTCPQKVRQAFLRSHMCLGRGCRPPHPLIGGGWAPPSIGEEAGWLAAARVTCLLYPHAST